MPINSSKISDPELRRFAKNEDEGEPRTVIVELSEPPIAFPAEREPHPRGSMGGPGVQIDVEALNKAQAGMTKLEGELRNLGLDRQMVRLNHAQAFIVTASAEQLRVLSKSPLVGLIRPNRTHQIPRK